MCLLVGTARSLTAQGDTAQARIRLQVSQDATPVAGALVRAGAIASQTDDGGRAVLRLAAGEHRVIVTRIGFRAESLSVLARAGLDTTIDVHLEQQAAEIERIVVGATRTERRIEDVPLRVEVLSRDEVEEKMLMTPVRSRRQRITRTSAPPRSP